MPGRWARSRRKAQPARAHLPGIRISRVRHRPHLTACPGFCSLISSVPLDTLGLQTQTIRVVRTSASTPITNPMLDTADVIVVGGGVFGAAAALHLVIEGAGEVILLERDGVAEGTSAAGAGFIDPWAAGSNPHLGPEELAVEEYGLRFYAQVAEEHPEVAYLRNGCLWVAIDE